MDATVLIATYNRAALLDETLASLARMRVSPTVRWEAIVVDNNSTDNTRAVVERHVSRVPGPAPLPVRSGTRTVERAQCRDRQSGRGSARVHRRRRPGSGRVARRGRRSASPAAINRSRTLAGPVRPLWEAPPPVWLDLTRGDLWGTIAIQDHGADPFIYEDRRKVPLGANMAARRELFGQVGGFRADLGRTGGRLVLGQEVPELLLRARAAGLRGMYVPAMEVHHHIPAKRLTPSYFRKWWFGKGVSRAALERMQPVTELGIDLRTTPHLLGVPRYMYQIGRPGRRRHGAGPGWPGTVRTRSAIR